MLGGDAGAADTKGTVTVAEIVDAVDEPIRATRCEEGSPGCLSAATTTASLTPACPLSTVSISPSSMRRPRILT